MSNENTINQRLIKVRMYLDLSQEEVANAINKKRSAISKIEKGTQAVPRELLSFYNSNYKVSTDWLLTGSGSMFSKEENNSFTGSRNVVGSNIGSSGTTTVSTGDTHHNQDYQQQLALALKELEGARKEIELLKQMIDILKGK